MEEDDDGVRGRPCGAHLLQQPWNVLRRREAGFSPGPADQAETSSSSSTWVAPMTAIRCPLMVRRKGRGTPASRWSPMPTTGKRWRLGRRERVAKAVLPVVEPVVVGHRRHVDATAWRTREGAGGRAEHECLRRRGAAGRHGGLRGSRPTDRPGGGPARSDRGHGRGVRRQLGCEDALEVHVPAEREDDWCVFGRCRRARELIQLRRGVSVPALSTAPASTATVSPKTMTARASFTNRGTEPR